MIRGGVGYVLAIVIALGALSYAPSAEASSESGWGVERLIEYESEDVLPTDIAMDSSGNAMAACIFSHLGAYYVYSIRYDVGVGWGDPQPVYVSPDGIDSSWGSPKIAMDDSGNAIVVWGMLKNSYLSIYSSRYVAGVGWGYEDLLETDDSTHAYTPQVCVDSSGNAIVVWYQWDGVRYNIWANHYVVGTGWGTARLIEESYQSAMYVDLAGDADGNAIAAWTQDDGYRQVVWANRFVAGVGWGAAQAIDSADLGSAQEPRVAMDGSGNAIATWSQFDGTYWNILANRYVVGTGWGTAQIIDSETSKSAFDPDVAMDDAGNAVVAWERAETTRYDVCANRYAVGEGWGTAQAIEDDDSGYAYRPNVGMDEQGNAIVVWSQFIGTAYHVLSNRYVAGTGWGTFEFAEAEGIESTSSPRIAVDGSGNAVIVWMQGSLLGFYDAWANTYSAPDVTAPSLVLSSPSDGMTTDASVVTVSGTTEPGAVLVVNGVTAAVGDDGSFSCEIALVEGVNTITVTATDASGNSATVSREVTYDDPINDLVDQLTEELTAAEEELSSAMDDIADLRDDLDAANEEIGSTSDDLDAIRSQNLMLMVVMIVVALLAIAMVVMYFGLSRKVSRMGHSQAEDDLPEPPEA